MKNILDFIAGHLLIPFVIAVMIAAVIAFAVGLSVVLSRYDCKKLSENVGLDTQYHVFGGDCLVNFEGRWVPEARWINNTGN